MPGASTVSTKEEFDLERVHLHPFPVEMKCLEGLVGVVVCPVIPFATGLFIVAIPDLDKSNVAEQGCIATNPPHGRRCYRLEIDEAKYVPDSQS